MVLVHVGGGELCGRTTGANALFCFTADTMFAGEKEKIPEELLQLDGKLVEEAMVGLEGTTVGIKTHKNVHGRERRTHRKYLSEVLCQFTKTSPIKINSNAFANKYLC